MQEHISKKLNNDRMIKAQAGFILSTLIQKSCDSDNRFSYIVKRCRFFVGLHNFDWPYPSFGKANHKYIFSAAKMSNFDSSAGNRDTEYGS